ncbi:ATP/GTP-binding protein, partial [Streptomyces sp. NPDC058728]
TTAGSVEAIAQITNQWPGSSVTPADAAGLERWWHYASFTVAGKRVGPLRIRGPELKEVFGRLAKPGRVAALRTAAHKNAGARSLSDLTAAALAQEEQVRAYLTGLTPPAPPASDDQSEEQYA